ncbi:MAG: UDP-N-acetylmuramoyl-L-alanyl-D-glutamate--2,6-diaminopimelate ligase [Bacteroidetes bacterium]|nr:MAG: UDP-N-acetylmuramoyl-L-alanyl-D-glutamate--2,6-diaminopimelate ligase [Bacteroidota bacterium]
MKLLEEIIQGIQADRITGDLATEVTSLHLDSREAEPGSLFAAIRGASDDGHRFIPQAIALGASVILCEKLPGKLHQDVTYVVVPHSATALGSIASAFYGHPSRVLKLAGITGTNGKTTTATLLYQLFEALGLKAGLISTIRNRIHQEEVEATHTTPDAIQLNRLIRRMADAGCTHCFMEVSSHAIDQQRTAGLSFAGGVFTNITHDHLDYHQSFDGYIRAKKSFFDQLSQEAFALVNKDDKHGMVMVQNCRAEKRSFGLTSMADFRCKVIENTVQGLHLTIDGQEVWFRLIGRFNAYNLLATYATAVLMKQDKTSVLTGLSRLHPVEGRFNYVISPTAVTAIVDYAHTPDALQNVLETINDIREGTGELITVVGAGGNRDAGKRPVMASIAAQLSNRVILTSDNPRFEEPEAILQEMKKGIPAEYEHNLLVITDRKEAIRTAAALARPGDYILVAGKGHERYQEIKGVKVPFDDLALVRELFGINETETKP